MAAKREPGLRTRALAVAAAAGGVGAGVALQLHHVRSIARDPDYLRLSAPLEGRPITVFSADGTRLHAEAFGPDTGATVVLAHGWTEDLRLWGPVIRILSGQGLRPVGYDLRGHGRSGLAAGHDYSLARFGDDVEAVLAAVTPEGQRATVVGHSLGAMSIAAWAQDHDAEARATAAAMVNTGLGDLISSHLLIGELAKRLGGPFAGRLFLGSRAPIPSFSSPIQHAVIRHAAFGPTATTGQVAFYERMLIACPPDVRAACGIAMSDMNLWPAVARLTIPTLVVAGDSDRLTPSAHGERIAETLPQPAGLVVLQCTGHMSPLEQPEQLAAALSRLVADTASLPPVAAL